MNKRFVVIASGRGSNFQAILDAIRAGLIPATCAGLFTDNPKAYAIDRAHTAGIPVTIIDYYRFSSKESYEEHLLSELRKCDVDLLVLAGYMRIVGQPIVREFAGRMINIHPALLPSFPGLHGQKQALEYGVKVAGCTVHFVDNSLDGGPVIIQRCVPVQEGDSEDTLASRILEQEHRCLPEAIKLFCEDRLVIMGRRVIVR